MAERKTLFGELAKIQTKLDAILAAQERQQTALNAIIANDALILANDEKLIALLQPPTGETLVLTLGSPIPQ